MWGGMGMGGGRAAPSVFETNYNCTSTAAAGANIDEGDKIYLPPSALDRLARMNVEYPMLFAVTNEAVEKRTHCGVLEFTAEEGWCYMPYGMMENLLMQEGDMVTVRNVSLRKASYVKFRAQSVDFLEVSNHRALLEVALRKFTCLTVGDTISIPYAGKKFYLDVRELKPDNQCSIIETDCNVDFEEPLGYKNSKYAEYEAKAAARSAAGSNADSAPLPPRELQKGTAQQELEEAEAAAKKFTAFSGNARRIDGKAPTSSSSSTASPAAAAKSSGGGESKMSDAKVAGYSSAGKDAKGISSSASTSSTAGTAAGSTAEKTVVPVAAAPVAPVYQSTIGSKYSKKKAAVSAFGGPAHKLS